MWPFNRKTFDVNNLDKISDKKFIKGLPVFLNKNVVLHPLKKRMFHIGRSIPKQYTYLLNEDSLKLIFERLVKVDKNLLLKNNKKLFSFMLETSTSPYIFNSRGNYNDENPLMKELRSIVNELIVKNEIYKDYFETLTDKKDMDLLNVLLMSKDIDQQYKNKILEFVYNKLMDVFDEIKKEQVNENSDMINGLAYDRRMLCNINYKNANNNEWINKISNALMNILSMDDIQNKGRYVFNKSSLIHFTLKNSNLLFNPVLIDDFFKDITEDKNSTSISNNTLIGRVLNILYKYPEEKYNKSDVLRTYFSLAMQNKISGFIDKEQLQEVFKKANKEIIKLIFDKEKNDSSYPFIFFNNAPRISSFEINAKKHYYEMISIIDAINPEFIKEMNNFEFENSRIKYYLNDVNNFDYLYYIFENKYMVNNKEHFSYSDENIITKLIKNAENLTDVHKVEKYIKNEKLFSIMDSNIITSYISLDFFSKLLDDSDLKNEDNVKNIILNEKFKMDYLLNLAGSNSDRVSFMSKLLEYYKNPEDEINKKYQPDMEIELKRVNACKELSLYFTDKISNIVLSNDYLSIKSLQILSQKLNEEDNINLFIKNVNDRIKEDYIDIIFNNENNPILKTYFEKRMITNVIKESDVNLTNNVISIDTEQLTITEPLKKKKRL